MNTDCWYDRVLQSAPDLIRSLLPNRYDSAIGLGLTPEGPGDRLYRFEAPELKELNHRLDAVLLPGGGRWGESCALSYLKGPLALGSSTTCSTSRSRPT